MKVIKLAKAKNININYLLYFFFRFSFAKLIAVSFMRFLV